MAIKKLFDKLPACYAGKILRIDLTTKTTSVIPTEKYADDYIGGRAMANRIYWEECSGKDVPALSAENTLIYMTGPMAGTGLPYAGRAVMTGISAKNIPEQYTHSSCGGFFGTVLKWAGYDGFILTGKAEEFTYIVIDDNKITFENAEELRGCYVQATQEKLFDKYGRRSSSLVIGPAGENLCRHASIVTHADSAFAKPGFGAVWGYKNLKAIVVRGTGTIAPADLDKVMEIHNWDDNPPKGKPETGDYLNTIEFLDFSGPTEPYRQVFNSCNPACNHRCMITRNGLTNPLDPKGPKVAMVGKCLDEQISIMRADNFFALGAYIDFPRQNVPGNYKWMFPQVGDPDDPLLDVYMQQYDGNLLNMWGPNFAFGTMINWCCNEYGLDKWDIGFWLFTWIYQCQLEGLFDDGKVDFGMPIDCEDPQFAKHILDCMVYRQGPMGDLLAEGVGRLIRALGKEKYGDTLRHGIFTRGGEERLTPVSWEASWGEPSHWQGRGFQGCEKSIWASMNLVNMIGARDEAGGGHSHDSYENYLTYKHDPCHSPLLVDATIQNNRRSEMKDSLVLCEYKDPDPGRPNLEIDFIKAGMGVDMTKAEIDHIADRGKLLERAILMRDHNRTREMEVAEVYPWMTYEDPWGETVTWDEWNDFVDLYYKAYNWDLQTGWPTREAWEAVDLGDVADFFEKEGKIPTGDPNYVRQPDPLKK